MKTIVCLYCKNKKDVKSKGKATQKYCSRKCFALSITTTVRVECSNCKKEIPRIKSDLKKHKNFFCSRKCDGEYRRGKPNTSRINQVILKCQECEEEFSVIKSFANRKFCSRKCYHDNKNKNHKSKKIAIPCSSCGEELKRYPCQLKKNNYCSEKCMGIHYSQSGMFTGENSPTWNGGKETYYGENWRIQRDFCRKRDQYTCQDCGITETEYGQELSVHHIIPFIFFNKDYKKANDLKNLVAICEPCHRVRHSGENHPTKFAKKYPLDKTMI